MRKKLLTSTGTAVTAIALSASVALGGGGVSSVAKGHGEAVSEVAQAADYVSGKARGEAVSALAKQHGAAVSAAAAEDDLGRSRRHHCHGARGRLQHARRAERRHPPSHIGGVVGEDQGSQVPVVMSRDGPDEACCIAAHGGASRPCPWSAMGGDGSVGSQRRVHQPRPWLSRGET